MFYYTAYKLQILSICFIYLLLHESYAIPFQVTVHRPICRKDGDLELALYGSFLPVPLLDKFKEAKGKTIKVSKTYLN